MTFDETEFAAFLDDISRPFLERDITRWRARMILPFSMVTATGPVLLETEADVERNFNLYLTASDVMHLTNVVRAPLSAELCFDGTVIATYKTELISNSQRVTAPYTASALMHPTSDGWKMSSILNARGHHDWTGQHPQMTGDKT
ncbi:hypothetical protein [Cognatishimia sp. F0-27]|uniref:hypothetical protein n=1 Tax=Cognatishimia sp. F0-27 TaxID=2816855 RepID=UPI001D0C8CA8|nr:hypothetical protein [Cognatishimia sp. F0-27]MCC1493252.1 hypothetical protein [Cognatishimia sp. F0-27]